MFFSWKVFLIGAVFLLAGPFLAFGGEIRIVTWNANAVFSVQDVNQRAEQFKQMATDIKPDILLLQEITSLQTAEAIRDAMGLEGFHVVCSDFEQDDSGQYGSLEVAIISRFPIDQAIEFDPSPDNTGDDPQEVTLSPLLKAGIEVSPTSRGYLWAHIGSAKLTISVVHLKSSRGKIGNDDKSNAKKREFVIAAVADGVNQDRLLFPDYTYIVAGDFNVGIVDQEKNGKDIQADCYRDCGAGDDGYDDTHALLSDGLIGDLNMKGLTASLPGPTYAYFPGSPVDNIYVHGGLDDTFSAARKSPELYGSDHYPVWVTGSIGEDVVVSEVEKYYLAAAGKTGDDLRAALHQIIKGHFRFSYSKVWQVLMDSDQDPENPENVILLYSGRSQPKNQNSGQNSSNPDYWNREHVWAKSHGFPSSSQAAYTDVHHLRPSDMSINSSRGNKDFDEGGSAHQEAPDTFTDADSWEPRDEVKGDIARMMFYMDVRYEGDGGGPDLMLVNYTDTSSGEPILGKLCTLVKWHQQDQVNDWERQRNEKIYQWQKNRNPFIDHPEWVQDIWGGMCQ